MKLAARHVGNSADQFVMTGVVQTYSASQVPLCLAQESDARLKETPRLQIEHIHARIRATSRNLDVKALANCSVQGDAQMLAAPGATPIEWIGSA